MFNKSIAYRLSVYISLAVISVFITFIIIIYIFNINIVKNNIENQAIGLSTPALITTQQQLASTREITLNISEQVLYYGQYDNIELFITPLIQEYPFLNAIHVSIDSVVPNISHRNYFVYREGDSILYEQSNEKIIHCANEHRIFEKAELNNSPTWTNIFNCNGNENSMVSFYVPIKIQREDSTITVGSIISELSLEILNDTISSLKIAENGYAFLVSQDGTYLTHPNKDFILKRSLFKIPKKEYNPNVVSINQILNSGKSGTSISHPAYLNYEKCWSYYTPIKETGWVLIVIVPYSELSKPLFLLILRMLFFAVIGILIIFFIVTHISNKLIEPLSTVTSQLKKFSNLTGEVELNTLNEITIVEDSLDYLKSWYEKFRIEQHQEQKVSNQRKQDLEEASEIQMSLIKTDFSDINKRNDINLFAVYKPARIVSGDLFDYFFLDDDNLFFSIGDVSGKGISAAFFMSVAQTIIKSKAHLRDPGKIVFQVNNELYTANQHQFFLTLFVGVFNVKTGFLRYCNAAHTTSVVLSQNAEIVELGQSHGMPLGIYPNKEYLESNLTLNTGDIIVLYSDGVTELQNQEKAQFGMQNVLETLRKLSKFEPQNLIEHVESELEDFKGKAKQIDDITIMALNYKNKKKA